MSLIVDKGDSQHETKDKGELLGQAGKYMPK